jgi:hypothetical protein
MLNYFLLHKKSPSLRVKESKTPGRSCDRWAMLQLKKGGNQTGAFDWLINAETTLTI